MSEVAKHDKDGDAWTVVHRKVLDISEFIPRHPGGKAVLKQYAGKVCQLLRCAGGADRMCCRKVAG